MDALILSCGTGGGHNSAGMAICEELRRQGNRADFLDPFTLQNDALSSAVSMGYVRMAQKAPHMFGFAYELGEIVRRWPGQSPVYYANRKTAQLLAQYLEAHHYDVLLTTHLYPAEMLTYLKRKGCLKLPSVFVATDYTCIPFTEETECDYYIIPGEAQRKEFADRGIPEEKLKAFGIPVAEAFYAPMEKGAAKKALGLKADRDYILLAGGSIGAGRLFQTAKALKEYFGHQERKTLIVICGSNEKLYREMKQLQDEGLMVIRQTDKMALYMKACDLFLTKAGGISSTEAAVQNIPMIHIPSIPGCESHNMAFFDRSGMSLAANSTGRALLEDVQKLGSAEAAAAMIEKQKAIIPQDALFHICGWLSEKYERDFSA